MLLSFTTTASSPAAMAVLVAGALGMDLTRFVIAGTVGRLLHVGGLVLLGNVVMHAWRR